MTKTSSRDGVWTKIAPVVFEEFLEAAGAWPAITTSYAETDTPAQVFSVVSPDTIKAGILKRIQIRLNWANAVTLTAIRIYEAAKAGNYESRMHKIFDSTDLFPAGITDDDEIDIQDLEIPFTLEGAGILYIACEWSAAPGNTNGYVRVSGIPLEAS